MSFATRRNRSQGAGGVRPHIVRKEVDIDSAAPSVVRGLVRRAAEDTPVCEDAVLLSSEITTNAVMHGTWRPGDVLTVSINRHLKRLEVAVTGPGLPKPMRSPNSDRPGGFGLGLVSSISDDWAMEVLNEQSTRVWFELDW
jgi:hypothetical protein